MKSNQMNKVNASIYLHYKRFFSVSAITTRFDYGNAENATLQISTLHTHLQLCAKSREPVKGMAFHAQAIRLGFQPNTLTSNMLMNVYWKCGIIDYARNVFDEMPDRSVVSWNTMIGTYTQNEKEQAALDLFLKMLKEGNPVSEFTVSSIVCACAAKSRVFECKQLHGFAIKVAMWRDVFVATALLDVYAKSGLIKDATFVFEGMEERSDVTWSSMIAGYVQNELYEEALEHFRRGQRIGLEYNQFTLSSVVCACAGLAALIEGKQLHCVVCKTGFGANNFVACSLIDLYAKCGCVKEAYVLFFDIEGKTVTFWNAIISAFAKHSCSLEVMILFEKMQQMGFLPDEVTYVSVLSACSHTGLVDEGRSYFDLMTREHDLLPNAIHYSCMVDIFGRAGLIDEAYELIRRMPFDVTTASMWGSLLGSCRRHGNVELAEVAAKNLFVLEPDNAGNYVLLSNTYAANKRWEEVAKARKLFKETELKKERGESWIEIKDRVHTFIAGERNHPRIVDIYLELNNLLEEMEKLGYRVETKDELHNVEESGKQELVRYHSERLAFGFGLMCLPPSTPIRIMKNIRICGDCHSFMKLASSIRGREIIVRDTNRFHHFKNGVCSCREFW